MDAGNKHSGKCYEGDKEMTILNERPANMNFDAYKKHLKQQKLILKQAKKGYLVWLAIDLGMVKKYGKNSAGSGHGNYTPAKAAELKRRHIPFV